MRILHCIPNMLGGGAERQCALLAAAQVARGDETHVALIGGGPNRELLECSGAQLHWIRVASYYDPRILSQLGAAVSSARPDVLQTWLLQMDVAAGLYATWHKVPWILTERASEKFYGLSTKEGLRRRLGRRASAIVANSEAGASYWRDEVRVLAPTYAIPNIVPLEAIDAMQVGSMERRSGEAPLVLFAGRLAAQKNLEVLIEALCRVLPGAGARALFCGEGPQEEMLRELIRSLGLGDRIELSGYRNDLWTLMKQAAVFVSVSHFEGQPNTVLEAMACGSPLVVSDIPEHREFLDDTLAWLADPKDVDAIAGAIANALRNQDVARRKSRRAYERVREFTATRCADRYDAVYRQIGRRR